ncbi:hypothetical protein EB796_014523 [Bugula neritina]|uniref:IgGFc-binding protein N-terminal domain-containing protein n=1 Tax=Bugula neritina TaxID=10212 RepID=A0A7J7JMB3_BUGNE|nr:hypothetical protein EB796_014523 [Bugula neritina]
MRQLPLVLEVLLVSIWLNMNLSKYVDIITSKSYIVVSEGDLSGSVITATEPVAVFSGNIRVGINAKSRDHIVEQLSPWAEASNEWIVVANGMTTEEIVKFTCTAGSTIQFPAYEDYSGDTFTFSASEGTASATVPQNYAAKVTASGGNCQLMLITISQASKNHPFLGDPTMSAIVPVSQYITSASFAIPVKPWRKLATGEVDDYKATLVVVALTTERSSIRLDGSAINSWQTISGSSYSVARVEVTRKDNPEAAVLNSLNGEKFSARLWGVADRESFAYTLGIEY